MKAIAVTNSGIAVNDTPVIVITRSVRLLRRRPAIAPPMMLSGTRITNATAASLSELVKAGPRRLETETWYCNEVPRSPWTKSADPVPVLRHEGAVGSGSLVEDIDVALTREAAKDVPADVAGQERGSAEHEHAENEQRDQGIAEPLQQKPFDPSLHAPDLWAGPPREATTRPMETVLPCYPSEVFERSIVPIAEAWNPLTFFEAAIVQL